MLRYISALKDLAYILPDWPYCSAARQLRSVILGSGDHSKWDEMQYRRRLETFGIDDGPVVAAGPKGEFDSIWYVLVTRSGRRCTD